MTLALAAVASCFWPVPAHAETADLLEAMALFRDGRALLAQGDYQRACAKLSESYRLDAGSGTLLALAICHERAGKLASAWGEYADVASRSKLENRADREQAARRKASELEPLVSTLTITLRDEGWGSGDVEVRRNGMPVSPALLGTAIPVDGGTQLIEASAPGRVPFRIEVTMADREQQKLVIVPWLEPNQAQPAVAEPARAHDDEPQPTPRSVPFASRRSSEPPHAPPKLSTLQLTGVAALGAGAIGLVVGSVYGVRALDKNGASKSGCNGDYCDAAGKQQRLDARAAGSISTIAFVEGGVLSSVGIAMFLLGRSGSAPQTDSALRALPVAGPSLLGGAVEGSF